MEIDTKKNILVQLEYLKYKMLEKSEDCVKNSILHKIYLNCCFLIKNKDNTIKSLKNHKDFNPDEADNMLFRLRKS